ncbi:hypothetical protein K788_00037685 [Paraburkholderia caribensis MBA4]|uniref:Uncharacterized protein n=1 Tax=Paraburkholderia caribensis MBA4 TaxID=1323664 RepID=A0A0P0RBM4_9BURK|nr:hypothetical protein K788_00037685 [Paraburkholderia caribensis MBA4]
MLHGLLLLCLLRLRLLLGLLCLSLLLSRLLFGLPFGLLLRCCLCAAACCCALRVAGCAVSTTGCCCCATAADCTWSLCSPLLEAFGNSPVTAAVATRLATMTAPAATAMRG